MWRVMYACRPRRRWKGVKEDLAAWIKDCDNEGEGGEWRW